LSDLPKDKSSSTIKTLAEVILITSIQVKLSRCSEVLYIGL
jgi:hypothetical protein